VNPGHLIKSVSLRFEISEVWRPKGDLDQLIEKGYAEPLIWLKGQTPKVEVEPSIEKDRCPRIIDSGRLAYERKQGLRFETPEARIMKYFTIVDLGRLDLIRRS
jgi:hypothetical protein